MAGKEHPERYNWCQHTGETWTNNLKEASDLTEAVKQILYEDYLQTYSGTTA